MKSLYALAIWALAILALSALRVTVDVVIVGHQTWLSGVVFDLVQAGCAVEFTIALIRRRERRYCFSHKITDAQEVLTLIEGWHLRPAQDLSLREVLGWSDSEYALWVQYGQVPRSPEEEGVEHGF